MRINKRFAIPILLLLLAGLVGALASSAALADSEISAESIAKCLETQECVVFLKSKDGNLYTGYGFIEGKGFYQYTRRTYEGPQALKNWDAGVIEELNIGSMMFIDYDTSDYYIWSTSVFQAQECEQLCSLEPYEIQKVFASILEEKLP